MTPLAPQEPSKVLQSISCLEAPKFRFELNQFQLPIGLKGNFGLIKHPGASLAVPITSDGEVIILRQYRFAIARRILEFPAGTLEPGEDPLTTMKRELAEEAGYTSSNWTPIGEMFPCPGYSDEVIHLFLATELHEMTERPEGDEDEDLEVLIMMPEELDSLIASGNEALDGKSITAWFRVKQKLGI